MKGIFFDTETGGLDSRTDALLQVAAAPFAILGGPMPELRVTPPFFARIKPAPRLRICKEALDVSGTEWEHLDAGLPEEDAYYDLLSFLGRYPGTSFWAHNAAFDEGFLIEWENRVKPSANMFYRADFNCSQRLANTLRDAGYLPRQSSSLARLARHFGKIQERPHRADNDAKLCVDILFEFAKLVPALFNKEVLANG